MVHESCKTIKFRWWLTGIVMLEAIYERNLPLALNHIVQEPIDLLVR